MRPKTEAEMAADAEARGSMTPSERGRLAVVAVAGLVVLAALIVRIALTDEAEFVVGVLVGVPVGALLGWLTDGLLKRLVDLYMSRLRGR